MKEAIETFKKDKLIHKKYAYKIISEAQKLFRALPTLVDVTIPENKKFTVCGDIHGQFFDLVNIFEINGYPSTDNPYLFNGDFVDRGSYSVECILTLLGFKVLFPDHFHMTRGNHESQEMNQIYGFESEVKSKYSSLMYDFLSETFEMLPLCYCLNKKVLVMHGGLPKEEVSLNEIRKIDRFRKPPSGGLMCDLLWSDPTKMVDNWTESKRGVGIQFGVNITERFCKMNNLDYIIRSHEVKMQGYDLMHNDKCITIFSAPNYCGTIGNLGAYIILNSPDLKPEFYTFQAESSAKIKPMAYASKLFSYMT
ncbi:hypothetical protein RND71_044102 [Anisodus tanguticus]|uniref:protein-serine/threonine phosphatase n=1 Tax=Anisodus tanguticus TaxID=243964 RepID=A0AAE1QNH2_9SOLA|nr:hypothetical protein RND71_044102 [Anisodus tanguticus]